VRPGQEAGGGGSRPSLHEPTFEAGPIFTIGLTVNSPASSNHQLRAEGGRSSSARWRPASRPAPPRPWRGGHLRPLSLPGPQVGAALGEARFASSCGPDRPDPRGWAERNLVVRRPGWWRVAPEVRNGPVQRGQGGPWRTWSATPAPAWCCVRPAASRGGKRRPGHPGRRGDGALRADPPPLTWRGSTPLRPQVPCTGQARGGRGRPRGVERRGGGRVWPWRGAGAPGRAVERLPPGSGVLIVDDHEMVRIGLKAILQAEPGTLEVVGETGVRRRGGGAGGRQEPGPGPARRQAARHTRPAPRCGRQLRAVPAPTSPVIILSSYNGRRARRGVASRAGAPRVRRQGTSSASA